MTQLWHLNNNYHVSNFSLERSLQIINSKSFGTNLLVGYLLASFLMVQSHWILLLMYFTTLLSALKEWKHTLMEKIESDSLDLIWIWRDWTLPQKHSLFLFVSSIFSFAHIRLLIFVLDLRRRWLFGMLKRTPQTWEEMDPQRKRILFVHSSNAHWHSGLQVLLKLYSVDLTQTSAICGSGSFRKCFIFHHSLASWSLLSRRIQTSEAVCWRKAHKSMARWRWGL